MSPTRRLDTSSPASSNRLSYKSLGFFFFLLGVAAFLLWRYEWVPRRVELLYALGEEAYLNGNMSIAAEHLESLDRLDADHFEGHVLLGWAYWRLGRLEEAEATFTRVYAAQPDRPDVIRGLGTVQMALGKHAEAIRLLEDAAWNNPQDLELQRVLADAHRRGGSNLAAARIYRELLWRNPGDFEAEQILLQIFGYAQLDAEADFALPMLTRPDELQLPFRTQGDVLQARQAGGWRSAYVTGAILSPARPGEFAVTASLNFETYRTWLSQIGEMNATTVRVYTILPPAFYQALAAYNAEAAEPLWLLQGVWLDDLAADLFDPETTGSFESEVRDAIDVIHGRADVTCRAGHYCGVYTGDVSPWVLGLALGRDMEPALVRRTNQENPNQTAHAGSYIFLVSGSPSEAWFARMLDLAARYETEKYNTQRPLTVVNWPALDPLEHPTEVTLEDELRVRRALGEQVADSTPAYSNDLDGVAVDVTRFSTSEDFRSGLFALYHIFQHRPGFLSREPAYLAAADDQGTNPFLGYLLALKAVHPETPLLLGAFGLSSSLEASHLHPYGWHNGGLTEAQQAGLLVRFSENIRDAGLAGGIVFEWLDEWWKQVDDPAVAPLEGSRDSDPIWLNRLDPEEAFGLSGFQAFGGVPLLRGETADWRNAQALYPETGAGDSEGSAEPELLRGVQAMSDYAYLYLRVDLGSAARDAWINTSLLVALNTLPGEAGSSVVPGVAPSVASGATFLVRLDQLAVGRLLVAENYNPWESQPVPGRPTVSRIMLKPDMAVSLDSAAFEDLMIEVNPPRWSAEGTYFPPRNLSWSTLTPASNEGGPDSTATDVAWRADEDARMVEMRIPWTKLLVLDPARRLAFAGTERSALQARETQGVSVAVFAVGTESGSGGSPQAILYSSLPRMGAPAADGRVELASPPAVFSWEQWNEVLYRPYLKPAYYELRNLWGGWTRWLSGLEPAPGP